MFELFKRKKTPTHNLLRCYANFGIESYSNMEKEKISEAFLSITKDTVGISNPKFDISGTGYGISKGSPFFGEKAYRNKIAKKGYDKMWGLTIRCKDETFESHFSLAVVSGLHQYFDASFKWKIGKVFPLDLALEILKDLEVICDLRYAYAYQTTDRTSLLECTSKSDLFSTTSYMTKSEVLWTQQILEIPNGIIKRLYPVNYFTKPQYVHLSAVNPRQIIKMKNEAEVWILSEEEIKRMKGKIESVILR